MSVLRVDGDRLGHEVDAPARHDGPQILLCTEGSAVVHAKSGAVTLRAGRGGVGGGRRRPDPAGRPAADQAVPCHRRDLAEGRAMSAEGSTKAILAALLANAGIAVAKFVGYLITGSSSMLAESVHSVADTSNQALLLFGPAPGSQAGRPAAPVRVRPQPLLLLVRRGACVVHPRLGVRALRGLSQDLPPAGVDVSRRGDRDPGRRDLPGGLQLSHRGGGVATAEAVRAAGGISSARRATRSCRWCCWRTPAPWSVWSSR